MKSSPLITAVQLAGLPPEAHAMRSMAAGKLPDLSGDLIETAKGLSRQLGEKPAEAMRKIANFLPSANEMQSRMRDGKEKRRKEADEGKSSESSPLRDEDVATIRLLLARGANREGRDESGQTALAHAASAGKPELIRVLLDAGALIEAEDEQGRTPLMLAAEECRPESVRVLLQRGADVHARTRSGETALMAAAKGGSKSAVQHLLAAGAEVTARAENGSTALLMAAMQGYQDIVELLQAAGAETGFLEAVALGNVELVSRLMPKPGSQCPEWGRSLLAWAARGSRGHRAPAAPVWDDRRSSGFVRQVAALPRRHVR
jgi:hypothetical protein